MTDKERMLSDSDLQALFEETRQAVAPPSEALQARILADAATEHRKRQANMAAKGRRRSAGRWVEWLVWPTGLTAACAAGLWIGWSSGTDIALTLDDVWNSSVGEEIAFRLPGLAGTVAGY